MPAAIKKDSKIKENDIVTVYVEGNQATNTYTVLKKIKDSCLLTHPLNFDMCILKKDDELNKIGGAFVKSPTENCLWFAKNNQDFIDYDKKCELRALCLHFILYRKLSNTQKGILSNICGYIAGAISQNDLDLMMTTIVENKALLDTFNAMWYENYKDIFEGRKKIKTKNQRFTIQNICGFVLSQVYS